MSTIEKLFAQIFERKQWIIDQVKHQTELFDQNLASKLLLQGIHPPPWLLNPAFCSQNSEFQELKKEELISGILLTRPRPAASYSRIQCSVYDNPAVAAGTNEFSVGFLAEQCAANNDFEAGDGSTVVPQSHVDAVGCASKDIPRQEISTAPLPDQADASISGICPEPFQSLPRIQRSRSRQRALELRNSASAGVKTSVNGEKRSIDSSVIFRTDFQQPDNVDEQLESVRPSSIFDDNCRVIEGCKEEHESSCAVRITSPQQPNSVNEDFKINRPSDNFRRSHGSILEQSVGKALQHAGPVDELIDPSDVNSESCGVKEATAGDCLSNINRRRVYNDTNSRSRRSFLKPDGLAEPLKMDSSSDKVRVGGDTLEPAFGQSVQELNQTAELICLSNKVDEAPESCEVREAETGDFQSKEQSNAYCGRITRSRSSCPEFNCANKLLKLDGSSNIAKEDGFRECIENSVHSPKNILFEPHCDKVIGEGLKEAEIGVSECNEKGRSIYCGRSTNTKSFSQKANKCLNLDGSSHVAQDHSKGKLGQIPQSSTQIGGDAHSHYEWGTQICPGRPSSNFKDLSLCSVSAKEHPSKGKVINECAGKNARTDATGSAERKENPLRMYTIPGHRVTRSTSAAPRKSLIAIQVKRSEGSDLQKVLGTEVNSMLSSIENNVQEQYAAPAAETGLVSDGPVEALIVSARFGEASVPPNAAMFLEPKQLNFDDVEDGSLNARDPTLEKERQDRSLEMSESILQKPAESLNKIASGNYHERCSLPSDELMPEERVVLSKKEVSRGSFENHEIGNLGHHFPLDTSGKPLKSEATSYAEETDEVYENVVVHASLESEKILKKMIDHSPTLDASGNYLLGSLPKKVRDSILSGVDADKRVDSVKRNGLGECDAVGTANIISECGQPDTDSYRSPRESAHCNFNEVAGSIITFSVPPESSRDLSAICPLVCVDETNDNDVILSMESCSPSETGEEVIPNLLGNCYHTKNDVGCSESSKLQNAAKCRQPNRSFSTNLDSSWPQCKRRKIEDRLTNASSASPSLRVREDRNIHEGATNGYLNGATDSVDAASEFQHFSNFHKGDSHLDVGGEGPDSGMCQDVACQMEDFEYSPKLQDKVRGDAQLGLADPMGNIYDVSRDSIVDGNQNLSDSEDQLDLGDTKDRTSAERTVQEMKPEDGLFLHTVGSSHNLHLDLFRADQDMPVVEGFFVQMENGKSCVLGDEISFDELNVVNSAIKRASVLEQLCRSASAHTPLPQFSNAYKLYGTQALNESLPNGLLECKNLGRTFPLDFDSNMQPEAGCTEPSSTVRFVSDVSKPYQSPAGKLWEGFTFKFSAGSSERQGRSNPDLTCFPIKEEDNVNADEVVGAFHEDRGLMDMENSAKREPLGEINGECSNPPALVSTAEIFNDRLSLESVNTEISFTGTCSGVRQNLRGQNCKRRVTKEGKENQYSVAANGVRRVTESLRGRVSKQKLSGKSSLRNKGPLMSERGSKHNNIVSNITSFVPLVQQKQAAAVVTGKRDVKVKALEAAEAAKRLEEKKEIERQMKKEAMKLQRTRLEQEKELKKKMKEEEQKKKDAGMAAKKRLREEGERKEKERKRKRIEEVRRQQKEAEGKLRADKEGAQILDERLLDSARKKLENETAKHENMDKAKGGAALRQMTHAEQGTRRLSVSHDRKGGSMTENCDAVSGCSGLRKVASKSDVQVDNFNANTARERSYELSPYQGSDDEEEEEDDIPNKKYIPSWASKSSLLQITYSQREVDPNVIFPREMVCAMDEVLLPRKQYPKLVAK